MVLYNGFAVIPLVERLRWPKSGTTHPPTKENPATFASNNRFKNNKDNKLKDNLPGQSFAPLILALLC